MLERTPGASPVIFERFIKKTEKGIKSTTAFLWNKVQKCLSKKYISLEYYCSPSTPAWTDTFPKGFLVGFHSLHIFKGFRKPASEG